MSCPCSRSRKGSWLLTSFSRATSTLTHDARSISGNSWIRPERGGHSSSNVLLTQAAASRSPSAAQTVSSLPPARTSPSSTNSVAGQGEPSSSANSRSATANGSSPSPYSPLGIDQPPASFFAQNGPPMCPISTSSPSPARRYSSTPALVLGISGPLSRQRPSSEMGEGLGEVDDVGVLGVEIGEVVLVQRLRPVGARLADHLRTEAGVQRIHRRGPHAPGRRDARDHQRVDAHGV